MRTLLVSTGVLLAGLAGAGGAAKVKSGLQPGEKAGAFQVLDSTGPNQGKTLCYR